MGKADRERIARINAGLENPIARTVVKLRARGQVMEELTKGSVDDQTGRLNTLVGEGVLPPSKLRDALMKKAPGEMDKAIRKFRKEGREISVDSLTAEVKSEKGFLKMCEKIGLNLQWFEDLARERMKANGL